MQTTTKRWPEQWLADDLMAEQRLADDLEAEQWLADDLVAEQWLAGDKFQLHNGLLLYWFMLPRAPWPLSLVIFSCKVM